VSRLILVQWDSSESRNDYSHVNNTHVNEQVSKSLTELFKDTQHDRWKLPADSIINSLQDAQYYNMQDYFW